jgi:hypothetical protein
MCTRGHWRPSEDEKLKELVALYGPHNWNAIAEKLQGRSGTKYDQEMISYIHACIREFLIRPGFVLPFRSIGCFEFFTL